MIYGFILEGELIAKRGEVNFISFTLLSSGKVLVMVRKTKLKK